jgi:DNA-binding transcriptional MerR regulator
MDEELTIGAVANLSGLSVDTIRFYEKKGLIEPPARNASGYRIYQPEIVDLIAFIKRGREMHFSLEEISNLIDILFRGGGSVESVLKITREKINDIEERLEKFERARRQLKLLVELCETLGEGEESPLLNHFLGID